MIGIEERVNQLLFTQERAIRVARSYNQHYDSHGLPPEELSAEFKMYSEAETFCSCCPPSLIMIPSPACYKRSEDFWPNYFRVEHNVRGISSAEHPFQGVKGAYFPFHHQVEGQHFDIVEMDNPSYFNSLSDEEKTIFMKRFFSALQSNIMHRGTHVALSMEGQDRTHVTFGLEAYVGFASRRKPDYTLKVDKIAIMDLSPYRIYGRDFPH